MWQKTDSIAYIIGGGYGRPPATLSICAKKSIHGFLRERNTRQSRVFLQIIAYGDYLEAHPCASARTPLRSSPHASRLRGRHRRPLFGRRSALPVGRLAVFRYPPHYRYSDT